MIRDNREYRNIPMFAEKRADNSDEPTYVVEGYASTWDEYELWNDGIDSFRERIERNAFDNCDMSDVVFLLDHAGRVYARTKNGTVGLSVDDHGLKSRIDLSKSAASRGVHEDIECGNYDQMSFAFVVAEDSFEHDRENHIYRRIIKRVGKLFDISAVGFPANPNTEIGVSKRSVFDGFIESENALDLAREEERRNLESAKAKFYEVM